MKPWRAAFLFFLALSAVSPIGRAEPSSGDIESARQLLRQGNELRAKDDLRGALKRYQAAHALVGTPITGYEVGRTHVQLGELIEGLEALESVAAIPVKANESANATKARTEAARLAQEIAPKIPSLRVLVRNASGTPVVRIDGTPRAADVAHKVNPGKHGVVVEANGATRTSEVTLAEGESRTLEVAFEVVAAPAKTDPPAPETPGRPTWVWVGFGIAGAGVIAGAASGVYVLSTSSELRDRCPTGDCPPAEHDRLRSADRWATVSTVSFAVAGAAAAVSVIGLLATPVGKGDVHATVGLGSISVEGRF